MQNTAVNNIDWIFFDIGNVVFYDLPLLARIWKHFYLTLKNQGFSLSYGEMLDEREKILLHHPPEDNPRKLIAQQHAPHIPGDIMQQAYDYLHLYPGANVPLPGVVPVLDALSRSYNLGVIANQPMIVTDELDQHDLTKYFRGMIISEDVGLPKPDIRIFEHALAKTGAEPSRCLMVGDRIDNDIRPAKRCGMRTVWLDNDYRKMPYAPADDYERLYIKSYLRISGVDQRFGSDDAPDVVIASLGELPAAVDNISRTVIRRTTMEVLA